jgi:hypothetical protein
VTAVGARAGDVEHASRLELPAATTTTTPASVARRTASSVATEPPSMPSDRFATIGTAGSARLRAVTQSSARTTSVLHPEPSHPSTRTSTSWASVATPSVAPPTSDATSVPCPRQSPFEVGALATKS